MVARRISRGRCAFCNKELAKSAMTRHLQNCPQRAEALKANPGQGRVLHLVVEGRYQPEYWIHLELPAVSTLGELDDFLRRIWLECCGHMSAFRIGGRSYSTFDSEYMPDERSMYGVKLNQVLHQDQRFHHEYDFGTTTDLTLRIVGEREGPVKGQPVHVLARNQAPVIPCGNCGKPATQICTYCVWEASGWLCDECETTHGCDPDMRLPVVNSPRTGMCGYTGESQYGQGFLVS